MPACSVIGVIYYFMYSDSVYKQYDIITCAPCIGFSNIHYSLKYQFTLLSALPYLLKSVLFFSNRAPRLL